MSEFNDCHSLYEQIRFAIEEWEEKHKGSNEVAIHDVRHLEGRIATYVKYFEDKGELFKRKT
jgi:hypothetical protein